MNLNEYAQKTLDTIVRHKVLDSSDITKSTSAHGTSLQLVSRLGNGGGSSGNNPVPAIVTGGTTLTGYTVALYANGYGQTSTGSGVAFVADLAAADTVQVGEYVMALPISITVTGDTE